LNKKRSGLFFALLCVYLILLQVIAIMALTKTGLFAPASTAKPFVNGHYYYMDFVGNTYIQRSRTLQSNDPQIVFIADSMVDRICVESIFRALNFSISGDTVHRVKERIKYYLHLEGKFVVLALGINDIPRPANEIIADYRSILDTLGPNTKIMVSSVLPVDSVPLQARFGVLKLNSQVRELNDGLEKLSSNYKNVYFEDTSEYLKGPDGALNPELQIGDGLHLNDKGNALWIKALKEAMIRVSQKDPDVQALVKDLT